MWYKCAARLRTTALNKDSVQEVLSTQWLEIQSLSPASPALLTPTLCCLIFGVTVSSSKWVGNGVERQIKLAEYWINVHIILESFGIGFGMLILAWGWSGFSPRFKTTIFLNKHLIYRICQMNGQLCLKENIWLGFGLLLTSLGTNPIGKMAVIHDLYCPDLQWEFNFWFDFG